MTVAVHEPTAQPTVRGEAAQTEAATFVAALTDPEACVGCGICAGVCPNAAIRSDDVAVVQADLCSGCGECVDICPRGALALVRR